ncbi:MAG: PEGA domain-containing protein [Acidobacteria bacterium]|nr:PEGA domain-containing protein [Acidobacteriota bacterium]
MRADATESEPPIDLPLHEPEPAVREEPSPLGDTVAAAEPSPASPGSSRGIIIGMLVLGLLAGFGAGFVVGQRLAPPPPPRAVEVPRPAPVVPAAPAAPSPPPLEPAVTPAENVPVSPVVEAPVEVQEPEVRPPAPAVVKTPVARPTAPVVRPATVRFDSRPPGATIYLDEVRVGVTPLTMNTVMPGTHQVRVEMLGRETWRTSVTVKEGEQLFVGASLE